MMARVINETLIAPISIVDSGSFMYHCTPYKMVMTIADISILNTRFSNLPNFDEVALCSARARATISTFLKSRGLRKVKRIVA